MLATARATALGFQRCCRSDPDPVMAVGLVETARVLLASSRSVMAPATAHRALDAETRLRWCRLAMGRVTGSSETVAAPRSLGTIPVIPLPRTLVAGRQAPSGRSVMIPATDSSPAVPASRRSETTPVTAKACAKGSMAALAATRVMPSCVGNALATSGTVRATALAARTSGALVPAPSGTIRATARNSATRSQRVSASAWTTRCRCCNAILRPLPPWRPAAALRHGMPRR